MDDDTWYMYILHCLAKIHAFICVTQLCKIHVTAVCRVLLEAGANPNILTDEGERPYDLIEPNDLDTVGVMLSYRAMHEGFNEEDEEEEEEESDVSVRSWAEVTSVCASGRVK